MILDESQAIKNLNTQTAQAALTLTAKHRIALSGTPIENNLGELYTLFRFLNPAMFNSAADFNRDYAQPIQKENDDAAADELRKKIYPFILRRLKNDVLKELPPKVEQVLYVEMGEAQKKHYEERRLFYKAIIDGEIESAKSERLLEALEEAVSNGRKCLVFSNFLAGVEQVCSALNTKKIKHLRMTGATADRELLVERFQNDPKTKVFVMSLKTGGVGLNLTAADTVFILDPWWNTSAEAQAVDRAHRIGQRNTVFTYRLIAKDSIEEKIRQLQEKKKNLVDQVVSSDSGALGEEFTFIGLLEDGGYQRYDQEGLTGYSVSIPPAIRKWLKRHFPKPEGYDIQPLPAKEYPKPGNTTYDASPSMHG